MLLVIASRFDRTAPAIVEGWRDADARLMTCRDLSRTGWRYFPEDPRSSRAVIGEEIIPFDRIAGAVICTPAVGADELVHIRQADRTYVAAEMNAFLSAWLFGAGFPVVNRPSAGCLAGPNWSRTRWIFEAARVGMRTRRASVKRARRISGEYENETGRITVSIVGDRCFGNASQPSIRQARRLASKARVQTLTVMFEEDQGELEFVCAYPGVDLSDPVIADAVLDYVFACACV